MFRYAVNRALPAIYALACACLSVSAQTNLALPKFDAPDLALRPVGLVQVAQIAPSSPPSTNDNLPSPTLALALPPHIAELTLTTNSALASDAFVISRGDHEGEFYGSFRPDHFYLDQLEPRSESRFVRAVEDIFEPASFRVGKTTMSCTLVTAIKKKNPLCLLNPIFFTMSW
jgi:hypothetical protein